ncbi:4-aminobutyrate--2-oxoglutarate transaminase [Neorhizobium galegae]|uniref:4-aminobutyrate--2-oxoglutarate transaminase n=1 Tax=Neorhizobium galegae TaxID=399 RepID=UPI000622A934|nr:4-aminobutyrate--2-oxoglutarate transaminase [Neorhizobium galegae]KAB1123833.1 4-aminobutyrate--2-oxoglutarate transaminase [Neorhizobium galegae]MCQ1806845.1 4-aminobutyrate--2-oxoglutarate transaminase [Neorhizobium galegae]CDZ56204.1 4-aminobutyrate transaminase [Neorhizobium galegae bv. orientalis]
MTVSADLQSRQKAAVAGGVGTRGIFAHKALNAELWDVDGRRFVDFAAGIAVNNTGHRHPAVMRAVAEQAEHFTHTCFHVAPYEGYVRLAERLNAMAPTGAENRTMLVTTGAEAVENAVKIARAHTGRAGVIAFSGAFHGRTMLGMALTGKVMPYKKNFGPFPADIYHAPFPNPYLGFSTEEAIDGLERLFAADVDPERIAAFIVEPVQGEGGFNVAPKEFLVHLRAVADKYGIVLIADEIQAGMARTGRMFGFEHAGVKPDMITMAKGLAGGFPLSAVTGKAEIMNAAHPGGLGGTYAGNPLSVAAANAVLDVIDDEKLCERAAEVGRRITERLSAIASRQGMEHIGDVRGPGAMVAFELVEDRQTKTAAPALTARIVAEAEARGLILLSCGTRFNVIRLLPPLTIEWEVLEEGLTILEASIEAAFSDAPASAAA